MVCSEHHTKGLRRGGDEPSMFHLMEACRINGDDGENDATAHMRRGGEHHTPGACKVTSTSVNNFTAACERNAALLTWCW